MLASDPSFKNLTDKQLIWIYSNMRIDAEEKLEHTCDKCKCEMEKNKCIVCGEEMEDKTSWDNNSKFNDSKFKELAGEGELNG